MKVLFKEYIITIFVSNLIDFLTNFNILINILINIYDKLIYLNEYVLKIDYITNNQ